MNPISIDTLPDDFDGVFRFTNFTKEPFTTKWGNVEYTFPPMKRIPLVISNATPQEVQSIRKKFARDLAIVEFYKTPKFVGMEAGGKNGGTPALYTDSDLAPFIQRCLEPLPEAKAQTRVLPKNTEESFRKDRKGKNVTKVLDEDESLIAEGTPMA